jgi:hypothetical protein
VTPAALAVALAAVHAARPKTIRELHLDDVDLGNRRLVITGGARPLDDLTRSLLLTWLQHRSRHWPGTANKYATIARQLLETADPPTMIAYLERKRATCQPKTVSGIATGSSTSASSSPRSTPPWTPSPPSTAAGTWSPT